MSTSVQITAVFLLIIGIFGTTNCVVPYNLGGRVLPTPRNMTNDYTVFRNVNVAYKVHTEILSWDNAVGRCSEEGGRLAIIDTLQKIGYVAEIKPAWFNNNVWVGIRRTYRISHRWKRVSDGSMVRRVPWAPGKPIQGEYNCLVINSSDDGLANKSCWKKRGFVCERSS